VLQLIRLLKAQLRGDPIPPEDFPSQKIWHRALSPLILIAAPAFVAVPSGRVKRVRIIASDTQFGALATLNYSAGPLIPFTRATAVVAGIAYSQLQFGWGTLPGLCHEFFFDYPDPLKNPGFMYFFAAASAGAILEVHYE
jgi:hypothetical protein